MEVLANAIKFCLRIYPVMVFILNPDLIFTLIKIEKADEKK